MAKAKRTKKAAAKVESKKKVELSPQTRLAIEEANKIRAELTKAVPAEDARLITGGGPAKKSSESGKKKAAQKSAAAKKSAQAKKDAQQKEAAKKKAEQQAIENASKDTIKELEQKQASASNPQGPTPNQVQSQPEQNKS